MQSKRFKQTARNGRALGITLWVLLLLVMAAATSTTAIAATAAGPPQSESATVLATGDPPAHPGYGGPAHSGFRGFLRNQN
jgi:hypothetical protein